MQAPEFPRTWWAGGLLLVFGVAAVLAVMNLFWGELNHDEGWYLYAAQQVADCAQPYRDFAFTQGPVLPAVYSWANGLIARHGVLGGRLLTGLFGLLAALLSGALAARWAPPAARRPAALLAMGLLLCNTYHSYFSIVVKTYSLCALFLLAGAAGLAECRRQQRHGLYALAAGVAFALATGVRLSAGIWLLVAAAYFLVERRRHPRAGLWFGLGAGATLLLVFARPILQAPEQTWFWLVQYHAARETAGGAADWLYRAGFLSRFVQAYFVPLALLVAWLTARALTRPTRAPVESWAWALWAGLGLTTLVHGFAPFPYEDYQVMLMPLFAALLSAALVGEIRVLVPADAQGRWLRGVTAATLLAVFGAAFSSPLNQAWVLQGRDRIWWSFKAQSDLGQLRAAGRRLAEAARPGELLLTQDVYLAVEAGLRVPSGLEMGPFSYYPDWSDERAERFRVLNEDGLTRVLTTSDARWAAYSDYGFSIASPSITPVAPQQVERFRGILHERYDVMTTIPSFGQAYTTLYILERKPDQPREES